jgi:hypothetical protein
MRNKQPWVFAGLFLLWTTLAWAKPSTDNWLIDGNFNQPTYSIWPGGIPIHPGYHSTRALMFYNSRVSWNQATQKVIFGKIHPSQIRLSGWVSTQAVKTGAQPYMQARITIVFYNHEGQQVGGWPASAASVAGTTPWTFYSQTYQVPTQATEAEISMGLGHCTGMAQFDGLKLELFNSQGQPMYPHQRSSYRTPLQGWYDFQPPSHSWGTPLNLSFLNRHSAGYHGFVTVQNGHFVFQDGTRARFWGTDIIGPSVFMSHAQAREVARNLDRLGVNLVRLHQMDAAWAHPNIFNPTVNNTQTFSNKSLNRLDYLIYQLKKHGIYVYVDFLVYRTFRSGDQVVDYQKIENGAKGLAQFDPRIIALNEKYARMLLNQINPYTGLALKDDPVLVGSEVVNESSIFTGFSPRTYPSYYQKELQQLYVQHGGQGQLTQFDYNWNTDELQAIHHRHHAAQSISILESIEGKAYQSMKQTLASIHSHELLAGSNMGLHVIPEIWENSKMDFMDVHAYWDHPHVWEIHNDWSHIDLAPIDNTSQLLNPLNPASLIRQLSDWKVQGKPLIVTEWNDCFPNQYRIEGPLIMAAYGSLQDWDGMLQFDYKLEKCGTVRMTPFAINKRPDNLALYQVAALMYREGYIQPAKAQILQTIPEPAPQNLPRSQDLFFTQPWLPYAVRLAKVFKPMGYDFSYPSMTSIQKLDDITHQTINASGEQLHWNYGRGILTLTSPKVCGWVGNIGGRPMTAGPLQAEVQSRNAWAAIVLISLDNRPLTQSQKMALVAVGRAENSGQIWNSWQTGLVHAGHPPILMQGVQARIRFRTLHQYQIHSLTSGGHFKNSISCRRQFHTLIFTISPHDQASDYLLTRQRIHPSTP